MADQIVGYQSPAFAMSGQLNDLLEQQRQIKRQAMLDALNQQNVESEIASRNENTAGLAEQRRAHAQEMLDQAFGRKIAPLHMGQDLSNADPNLVDEMIQRGVATPGVNPEAGAQGPASISINDGFGGPQGGNPEQQTTGVGSLGSTTPKTNPTFNGSPAEQQGAEEQDHLRALAQMDLSKYSPIQRWAIARAYDPKGAIPADLFKQTPTGHIYTMGPDGKLVDSGQPSGTEANVVHNVPNAPRPTQPRQPQIPPYIGTTDDGKGIVVMTPTGPQVMPMPGGATINAKPGNGGAGAKGAGLYDNAAFNLFSRTRTNQNASDEDVMRAQANVINTIGGKVPSPSDLEIRQFIHDNLWDPNMDKVSPEQIQQQLLTDGNDPQLVQRIMEIYTALKVPGLVRK